MRLEIRDIESAMVYDIGPDGAVLGRERARTDISLRDESISKRHARIFTQDGTWFLEDLNSSNGTYVDDQRITAPIRLAQGRLFSLAQRRFEVVLVEPPVSGTNGVAAMHDYGAPPSGAAVFDETGAQMRSMGSSGDVGGFSGDNFDLGEDAETKGIGYFFVALPKAIGFYMIQAPLMGLHPIGRINASLLMPLPAMGAIEVAAYAIPAAFFAALMAGIFAVIAGAINGVLLLDGLLLALPMAGIAAAIGGVVGAIAHPVLEFLVNLFKGQSSPQSRTNCIIFSFVISIVAAVPNGVGALVSAMNVPYIHLLGPLLLLLVTGASLYFSYQWAKAFDIMKPVQYLVLAVGAVGVVLTALGFVNGLIDAIDGVAPNAQVAAAGANLTPEQRRALSGNPAAAAALAKANATQAKTGGDDPTPVGEPASQAEPAGSDPAPNADSDDEGAVAAEVSPPSEADRAASGPEGNPAALASNPKASLAGITEEKYPLGVTPFVVFLRKRDAIERAVEADPALIGQKQIKRDYERLWRITYEIRDKYYRKRGARWRKDKIHQREKGNEIFKRTKKYVDRLYRRLFQRDVTDQE